MFTVNAFICLLFKRCLTDCEEMAVLYNNYLYNNLYNNLIYNYLYNNLSDEHLMKI